MPPLVSDEETSNQDEVMGVRSKSHEKGENNFFGDSETPAPRADDENQIEHREDTDKEDEDVYVVEAITGHLIAKDGIRFHVKWEGYEDDNDMTWEPEENLTGSASEILNSYYESVGGREFILNEKNKKKRGRVSTGTPNNKDTKRLRNTDNRHPRSTSPPASLRNATFKPPTGSWEDEVQGIDACEGTDGQVMVYLQWSNGQKTQHPLHVVYKRCPQKMLKFYESHLLFIPVGYEAEASTDVELGSSKKARGRPKKAKTSTTETNE